MVEWKHGQMERFTQTEHFPIPTANVCLLAVEVAFYPH